MRDAMISRAAIAAFLSLALPMAAAPVVATEKALDLRLSLGQSWQERNDVQIPNTDEGTRFSLEQLAGNGPVDAARLEINYSINPKHGVRVLLAPLSYTESTILDAPVRFAGELFAADQPTDASYRFNSWRVGYHYTLRESENGFFRVGGTLKVRDAEIRLQQGALESFDDDVGLVPLLYLAGQHRLGNRWVVGADLDGLAGGPGRAIDAGLTLDFTISEQWRVGADLRILDGGADTDDVYNFARFNSAAIAISYQNR